VIPLHPWIVIAFPIALFLAVIALTVFSLLRDEKAGEPDPECEVPRLPTRLRLVSEDAPSPGGRVVDFEQYRADWHGGEVA
jgi:hypothetical protein